MDHKAYEFAFDCICRVLRELVVAILILIRVQHSGYSGGGTCSRTYGPVPADVILEVESTRKTRRCSPLIGGCNLKQAKGKVGMSLLLKKNSLGCIMSGSFASGVVKHAQADLSCSELDPDLPQGRRPGFASPWLAGGNESWEEEYSYGYARFPPDGWANEISTRHFNPEGNNFRRESGCGVLCTDLEL